jgi:hypothetical protein
MWGLNTDAATMPATDDVDFRDPIDKTRAAVDKLKGAVHPEHPRAGTTERLESLFRNAP